MHRCALCAALCGLSAIYLPPLAMAQAPSPSPVLDGGSDASSWRMQLTPYVWMAGMQGHLRVARNAPTAHVAQSFSDVLDHLDAAAFLSGTARKDRYVLQFDASYAALSDQARLPLGLRVQSKLRHSALTLAGGYHWPLSPSDSLDALVGVRWWNLSASVQLQPLRDTQTRASFADPIVALRWRHQFTPRWSTLLYTDLGGGGVGSKRTWQLLAVANYQIRDRLWVSAGYRQLHVDYRSGGRRLDVGMRGPVLGMTLQF